MASCTCDRADCYNCVFERGYQLGLNACILDTDMSNPMTTNPKPLLTRKQVAAFADMECDCTDPRCKFEESACRTIERMAELLTVQGVPKAEPVKAKEPWKPRMGEKVLVEALVRKVYRDMTVCVDIFDVNNDSDWAIVNLSQLRPLPVVQGEGVGK